MRSDAPPAPQTAERPAPRAAAGWPVDSPNRDGLEGPAGARSTGPPSTRFERWLLKSVLEACGNPAIQRV